MLVHPAFAVLIAAISAHGVAVEQVKLDLKVDDAPQGPLHFAQSPMEHDNGYTVRPVSTSMKCVINLTIQFLVVYTAVAICRTLADSFGMEHQKLPVEMILKTACQTVNYAPMLAVLFVACRMRVLWLTQGGGNPPDSMQMWMYSCTYMVLLMTLTVCIIPVFTGEAINIDPSTGCIREGEEPFQIMWLAWSFTLLKYIAMLVLYIGAISIMHGMVTYEPPQGSWPGEQIPPLSAGLQCIMILTCEYFLVYGLVQVARSFTQLSGYRMTKFENAMSTAADSINFAPMLAVLFLAARMRALQIDPIYGKTQAWTKECYFFCTIALAAQTLLSFIIPLVLQSDVRRTTALGGTESGRRHHTVGLVLIAFRFILMFSIYICMTWVIWSIFTIEHHMGPQFTAPISVTMHCVINLTAQFFVVYLLLWIGHTIRELRGEDLRLLAQTMENTKATVQMCPMLAVLFVGCRIRALQLTMNRGAPQGWVQDAMYVATWAVCIQFVTCLLTPLFTGEPLRVKHDGKIEWKPQNPTGFAMVQCTRWIPFVCMYGGVVAVVVGIFLMTPENATSAPQHSLER